MINVLYFLQAVFVVYVTFLAGLKVIKLLKLEFSLETTPFYAVSLGFGTLGLIGLIFSLFSLYRPVSFWVVFGCLTLTSIKNIRTHFKIITAPDSYRTFLSKTLSWFKEYCILKIIICAFVLVYFMLSFLPYLIASDALGYHLPYILKIIDDGKMFVPLKGAFTLEPNLSYGYLPVFVELIYGIPILLFKNLISFKIIQFFGLPIILFFIINFLSKKFKDKTSTWFLTILLLANMPLITVTLEGGYVDLFTILFGLLSTLIIVQMIVDDLTPKKALLASAIFLGLALSTKYIALFYVVLNGLLLIYFFINKKYQTKEIFKNLILYILPSILIAGFWYIKNMIYTGSPVFPMFSGSHTDFTSAVNSFYIEPRLVNFPLFPFVFFGQGMTFKLPYAFLTAVYFGGSYLMTLYLLIKKNLGKLEIIFFGLTEIYLFILFFLAHQVRFAVLAFIFIIVLFVLEIDKIVNSFEKTKLLYRIGVILVSLALFCGAVYSLRAQLSCLIGRTNSTACATRFTRSTSLIYEANNYINENLKDEKIIEYRNIFDAFVLKNGNIYTREDCDIIGSLGDRELVVKNCLEENNIFYLLDDTESRGKNKYPVTEYFYNNANIVFEKYDSNRNSFMRLLKLR